MYFKGTYLLGISDSVRPHRWQPTRLPCPWDSPGKNTGVGCHFEMQIETTVRYHGKISHNHYDGYN